MCAFLLCVVLFRQSANLVAHMTVWWEAEKARATARGVAPSLRRPFLLTFSAVFVKVTALLIVKHGIQLVQTQFLAALLRDFTRGNDDDTNAYLYALGIVLCTLLHPLPSLVDSCVLTFPAMSLPKEMPGAVFHHLVLLIPGGRRRRRRRPGRWCWSITASPVGFLLRMEGRLADACDSGEPALREGVVCGGSVSHPCHCALHNCSACRAGLHSHFGSVWGRWPVGSLETLLTWHRQTSSGCRAYRHSRRTLWW
jgi:hypothetical protein